MNNPLPLPPLSEKMCLVVFSLLFLCYTSLRGGCPLPPPPPNGQRKNKTNENEHQVTNIRYAKLGKDAGEVAKRRRRRLHRLKARAQNAAAELTSKHLDLMHIVMAI